MILKKFLMVLGVIPKWDAPEPRETLNDLFEAQLSIPSPMEEYYKLALKRSVESIHECDAIHALFMDGFNGLASAELDSVEVMDERSKLVLAMDKYYSFHHPVEEVEETSKQDEDSLYIEIW